MPDPFDVVIDYNPACGTLAMIRNAGIEPHVVGSLNTPPRRALIAQRVARAGLGVVHERGTPCAELGLAGPALTDGQFLKTIEAHPILLDRPLVASPKGVRLCRPSEVVLEPLPARPR